MVISRTPRNFVDTNTLNGVSIDTTRLSFTSNNNQVNKGAQNFLSVRPGVLSEHTANNGALFGTVSLSGIVGQIFAPTLNNITSALVTAEPIGSNGLEDDFESYINDAALQAVWTELTNTAVLETVIVSDLGATSTQSMELSFQTIGDEWINTITSTNFSSSAITFDFNSSETINKALMSFFVGDGTNTKSIQLSVAAEDVWQTFNISIANDLSEDGAGTTDDTAITQFGFRVVIKKGGAAAYVDNLMSQVGSPQMEFKLWDMGTVLPTSGVTSLVDGTQYITFGDVAAGAPTSTSVIIDLEPGIRLTSMSEIVAGVAIDVPANVPINTSGHFYAFSLHYVNTNVNIYGTNIALGTKIYPSGFAFVSSDESGAMSGVNGDLDLQFAFLGMQDEVFITEIAIGVDSTPGPNASYTLVQLGVTNNVINTVDINERLIRTIQERNLILRPLILPAGGRIVLLYNDDINDGVSVVDLDVGFIYNPPEQFGN